MSQRYSLPSTVERHEVLHEAKDGVRFFGATRIDSSSSNAASVILIGQSASIVLLNATSSQEVVRGLLNDGWDVHERLPGGILERVCGADGLVIDVFGFFDDPEVSVIVYGRKDILLPLRFVGARLPAVKEQ